MHYKGKKAHWIVFLPRLRTPIIFRIFILLLYCIWHTPPYKIQLIYLGILLKLVILSSSLSLLFPHPHPNIELEGVFPNKFSLSSMVVSNILFLWEECTRFSSMLLLLANILASQLFQIFMQKIFSGSEDGRRQWKIHLKKGKKSTALLFTKTLML